MPELNRARWLVISALVFSSLSARADEPNELVWAARICKLEAESNLTDCKAILHAARKLAEIRNSDWLTEMRAYSSLERSHTARAKRIRRLEWEELPPAIRTLVTLFAVDHDTVKDPCRRALHYGARDLASDAPKGRMIPARCSRRTVNAFYRLASR